MHIVRILKVRFVNIFIINLRLYYTNLHRTMSHQYTRVCMTSEHPLRIFKGDLIQTFRYIYILKLKENVDRENQKI